MREQRNSAFGDKSGNLRSDFQSLTPSKLLQSLLDNPLFSSKILECQEGKPSAECKENTESKKNLDSRFSNSDSESRGNIESSFNFLDSKSKQYTESPTPKNLIKALPDSNNNVRDSASRAQLQNCAIFAKQKSHKMCSAAAHTDTRPCRGGENALKKCSSAFLAFLTRQGDSEALPLFAEKEKRRFIFFGAKGSGEGINPFFFCDTQDSKKLESIRENASLRNRESTESSVDSKTITESNAEILKNAQLTESKEILKNEKIQNLGGAESRAFTESSSTDSETHTKSKEILKNGQGQNLSGTKLAQSVTQNLSPKEFTESNKSLDSRFRNLRTKPKGILNPNKADFTTDSQSNLTQSKAFKSTPINALTHAKSPTTRNLSKRQTHPKPPKIPNKNLWQHTTKLPYKALAKLLLIPCLLILSACAPRISDVPQDAQITLALSDSQERVNAHWWEDFHNPALLFLLTHAREFHTQNKLAKTQIAMAQNALKVARAQLYPHLSLSIEPAYNQTILHPLYALTQGNLDFSYHLDFFGKYRYAKQSKHYALQASIARSYVIGLTIDMLVAKTYIALLGSYAHLELLYTTLEARKRELRIMQERKDMGYISAYDAKQAIIAFESVQAQIAQTKRAIAMSKNALEYLTGVDVESQKFVRLQGFSMQGLASMESNARKSKPTSDITESKQPQALDSDNVCALRVSNKGVSGDLPQANCTNLSESSLVYKKGASPSGVNEVAAPNNNLDSIKSPVCTRSGVSRDLLPTNDSNLSETNCAKMIPPDATAAFIALQAPSLPSALSSKLLNHRPDVLYAEFMLASSSAYLKKARADFLPDFSLGLNLGAVGYADFTQFLLIGGIGTSVLTPLFKGGELQGAFGIANAQRDEAAYIYRDVVIQAYKEAKDAYSSLSFINAERASTKRQQKAAREALTHAKERYNTGYSSYLEVIDAQRSLLEIETNLITLKTLYMESLCNLYGALGGGIEYPRELLEER